MIKCKWLVLMCLGILVLSCGAFADEEIMTDSGEIGEVSDGEYMTDSGEVRDVSDGEYMTDSGEVRDVMDTESDTPDEPFMGGPEETGDEYMFGDSALDGDLKRELND